MTSQLVTMSSLLQRKSVNIYIHPTAYHRVAWKRFMLISVNAAAKLNASMIVSP